jgi:DNA repair exonuclease SbcCD nuclease subunit
MIRFLHTADLHLGWSPSYLSGEKQDILRRERDSVIESICSIMSDPRKEIDGMIIAGDLFEKYDPDDSTVSQVIGLLSKITSAGKLLITVPGNHDEITYNESVYRKNSGKWPGILVTCPNAMKVYETEIRENKVSFYSLAYTGGRTETGENMKYPEASTGGYHIGIFHGSLDWEGLPDRSLPLRSSDIFDAGYDYTALGHIHMYSEKNRGKQKIVYPGAPEFKSFNDPGCGHVTIVNISDTGIRLEKEFLPMRRNKTIDIDVTRYQTYEDLKDACMKHSDKELMLNINLKGTPTYFFDEENLSKELQDEFFYLKIDNSSIYYSVDYLEDLSKEPTLRGLFAKRMTENIMKAVDEDERKLLYRAFLKGIAALKGGTGR